MLNVIGKTKVWFTFSFGLLALSVFALAFNFMVHGQVLNFGLDFTGGTMLHLRFSQSISEGDIRAVLLKHGVTIGMVQRADKGDFYIRTEPMEEDARLAVMEDLKKTFGEVELLEADTIGPLIGKELRIQALWALLIATLGLIIYISFRFEFQYGAAALLALYHDAVITTGIIALLWRNVDVPFIAAILTILGYSINDTIVVFDRVRENLKNPSYKKQKFGELVNKSITETLARSINTVLTTIIMVLALLFFGGETLKDFALVLLIGFTIGAYSSIFVACPLIVIWQARK